MPLIERPTALAEILAALKRISGEQQCAMCKAELKEIAATLEGLGLFMLIEWPRLVGSYTSLANATTARARKHPDAAIWRAIVEVASDAPLLSHDCDSRPESTEPRAHLVEGPTTEWWKGRPRREWCPSCRACDADCCNPECGGVWGTGCYHCHHPAFGRDPSHYRKSDEPPHRLARGRRGRRAGEGG